MIVERENKHSFLLKMRKDGRFFIKKIRIDKKLDYKIKRFKLTHRKLVAFAVMQASRTNEGIHTIPFLYQAINIHFIHNNEGLFIMDITPIEKVSASI